MAEEKLIVAIHPIELMMGMTLPKSARVPDMLPRPTRSPHFCFSSPSKPKQPIPNLSIVSIVFSTKRIVKLMRVSKTVY